MAKRGRPSKFTPEVADAICDRIAGGESLRTICEDEGMPGRRTVLDWLSDEGMAEFRAKYVRAREAQADWHAEKIIEIADTPLVGRKTKTVDGKVEVTEGDMIEHRRLQVDARKWYAEKLAPKKYGEKVQVGGADDLPPVKTEGSVTLEPSEAYKRMLGG